MSKDYLKEVEDGVEVTLAKPATIDGQKRTMIKVREPKARDSETAQKSNQDAASAEIVLLANLCEITPEDVRDLTMRNYKRLASALELFTD